MLRIGCFADSTFANENRLYLCVGPVDAIVIRHFKEMITLNAPSFITACRFMYDTNEYASTLTAPVNLRPDESHEIYLCNLFDHAVIEPSLWTGG